MKIFLESKEKKGLYLNELSDRYAIVAYDKERNSDSLYLIKSDVNRKYCWLSMSNNVYSIGCQTYFDSISDAILHITKWCQSYIIEAF